MGYTERFWAELKAVHEAAGRPTLTRMRALESDVPVPGTSALNGWLIGTAVPGPDYTRFFLVLVDFLQDRAARHSDGAYACRAEGWWATLLAQARQERDGRQGGRPPKPPKLPSTGPVTLPPPPDGFTGRTTVLAEILAGLEPDGDPAVPVAEGGAEATVVVSSVAGMGGVGKSAVAVQAAHQARARGWFPGGILFADLRGYNPRAALDAGAVADRFLRILGVKAKDIPPDAEERCAAWHEKLGELADLGRSLLVVLDNVRDPGQVEALLPLSPHRALITSRQKLGSLSARPISLGPLTENEAVDLLDKALRAGGTGDTRISDEPAAARELVALCGYLPLALRIIAALLRDQPQRALLEQAADLAEARTRLDGMVYTGNDREGRPLEVRASFCLSYHHLTAAQALAFRLLSVAAGPDISATAVRELLDRPDARRVMDDLARAHLVNSSADGRWAMHDLIRLFANELGETHAAADQREAAIGRLHHHYRTTAMEADTHLEFLPSPGSARFSNRDAALAWLDAEHTNLVTTAVTAPDLDHPHTATALALSLTRYLSFRRHFHDLISITTTALAVFQESENGQGVSTALNHLGAALCHVRQFDAAIEAQRMAAALAREIGDRHGESGALNNLGCSLVEARRFEEAIKALNQAAPIIRELGDRRGEGGALNNLGLALFEVGRFEEAIDAYTQAAAILGGLGDRHGESGALNNQGLALQRVHRYEEAIAAHAQAAANFSELGDQHRENTAVGNLGLALQGVHRFEEAIEAYIEVAATFSELRDRHGKGTTLNNLGLALFEAGRFEEAIDAHTQAAVIARELDDRYGEGQAVGNLGLALAKARRFPEAVHAHAQAAVIARELGHRDREGTALDSMGLALMEVRRFEEAIEAHHEAATIALDRGDRHDAERALGNLGLVLKRVRRFEEAIVAQTQAAAIARETGDRAAEGKALNNLGLALVEVGRFEEAIDAHSRAVTIACETGDRQLEGQARNNLGGAFQRVHRFEEAIDAHIQAAAIARETGDRHHEGTALINLGGALQQVGRFEEAIDALTRSADVHRDLGDLHRESAALSNLCGALQKVRRTAAAVIAAKRRVEVLRLLAADNPSEYTSDLATSLLLLAWLGLNTDTGEVAPGTLPAAQEAAELFHQLALAHPAAFTGPLRTSLKILSNVLELLGRTWEAEQVRHQLAQTDPDE